ncbi:MAG: hypothetical protein QF570_15525 [Myxococcota bacterium]|jgi:hypothetical protein|nr:hypothetical protein [Myxococcota bacterium]
MTKTLKALVFPEPWRVELTTTEVPKPGPHRAHPHGREAMSISFYDASVGSYEIATT